MTGFNVYRPDIEHVCMVHKTLCVWYIIWKTSNLRKQVIRSPETAYKFGGQMRKNQTLFLTRLLLITSKELFLVDQILSFRIIFKLMTVIRLEFGCHHMEPLLIQSYSCFHPFMLPCICYML